MIYEHALVNKPPPKRNGIVFPCEAIVICKAQHQNCTPPLVRASRVIRDEALPIYLSRNVFYIMTEDVELRELYAWLRRVDRNYLKCLQNIQVVVNPPPKGRRERRYLYWLLSDTLPARIDIDPLRFLRLEEAMLPSVTTKIHIAANKRADQVNIFLRAAEIGRARRSGGGSWEDVAKDIRAELGQVAKRENVTLRMDPTASLWNLNEGVPSIERHQDREDDGHWGARRYHQMGYRSSIY
jgi:hypothetical protein